MFISSRTPEGSPARCPLCGHDVQIEPSEPSRDAPCPHCGHLLWFVNLPSQAYLFDRLRKAEILRLIAERLGLTEDQITEGMDLGEDSLNLIELAMELSLFDC